MPQSMTGFGRCELEASGLSIAAEVRTVNNRFLAVKVKLPPRYLRFETQVEEEVRKAVSRGTVDVYVRATSVGRDVAPNVDRELARAFVESIGGLGSSLGLEGALDLRTVLALPGVVTLDEPSEVDDAHGATIRAALRRALTDVVAMRATEGERLAAELVRLLKKTEALVAAIEKRAPQVAPELRRKLFRRIESLVDGSKVALEPGMLEKEVAVAADRCDVTEELARLASHLAEFRATLQQKGPIGRQLDFLAQEMGRESNTIGAKNQDLAISRKVIDLKAHVERLREQVQNIE